MTGSQYATAFQSALETLGFVVVKRVLDRKLTKVRLLMRVDDEPRWLPIVERFHRLEGAGSFHICKTYFLKGPTKSTSQLVYGWNLTLTSNDMSASLTKVVGILEGLRKSAAKVAAGEDLPMDVVTNSIDVVLDAPSGRGVFEGAKGARPVK